MLYLDANEAHWNCARNSNDTFYCDLSPDVFACLSFVVFPYSCALGAPPCLPLSHISHARHEAFDIENFWLLVERLQEVSSRLVRSLVELLEAEDEELGVWQLCRTVWGEITLHEHQPVRGD